MPVVEFGSGHLGIHCEQLTDIKREINRACRELEGTTDQRFQGSVGFIAPVDKPKQRCQAKIRRPFLSCRHPVHHLRSGGRLPFPVGHNTWEDWCIRFLVDDDFLGDPDRRFYI